MPGSDLTLEKYDGQHGLSLLYDDWLALMADINSRCFYHDPDWFGAYFASRDTIDPPITFFAVRRGEKLIAVIPLQRQPGRRPWRPTLLSMPVESQLYMPDCAIAATEDHPAILTFVLDGISQQFGWSWDRFTISHTLQASLIATALATQTVRKLRTQKTDACSVVPVRPYNELLTQMKAKYRQNLNRARRMIASLDAAEFCVVTEPDEITRTFEEFIELEASGWKGGTGKPRGDIQRPAAIALNDKKRRFYETAVSAFARRGAVEIFCVRAEGKLIGAEVWLVLGDTCFAMKTAYDENYSRMSPGVMAFDLGYQRHSTAGLTTSINTITSTPAVDDWLPYKVDVQNVELFNATFRGRLFATALHIRQVLRSTR